MNHTADLNVQPPQKSPETIAYPKVYLLLLGLAFASAGQAVFLMIEPESPANTVLQVFAGALLVAGAILFGVSTFRHQFDHARLELPPQDAAPFRFIRPDRFTRLWLLIAACLALAAIFLFGTRGETPLIVFLWLAGILALFASQLHLRNLVFPHVDKAERLRWIGLAILLGVALVTRVYHLTTLPYEVDADFAHVGLEARALVTGQQKHLFAFGWAAIPFLGYSPAAFSMLLFGTGLAGLNMSGVVEGLFLIIGVYLLGRDLFQPRLGLLAAALLTISYTDLAASRQSVYIDSVVFVVFAIYFLLLGLRQNRGWAVVASGLLSAFCLLLYYSARLVFPIIAIVLLFLIVFHRGWLKPRWGLVLLWGLSILVTLGPMLWAFAQTPFAFVERTNQVFFLTPRNIQLTEGAFHVNTLPAMLLEQAHRTALMFYYFPDKGTQFALQLPFLDPFTAVLFTLGLGYALFHWRRLGSLLLLSWVGLGLVIGCFLTVNPPYWPRLIILLPPCVLLASIALDQLYDLLHRFFMGLKSKLAPTAALAVILVLVVSMMTADAPLWLRLVILFPPVVLLAVVALDLLYQLFHHSFLGIEARLAPVISLALVLLLAGLGWHNWNLYVSATASTAAPRVIIARYLAEQPAATHAHLVSSYYGFQDVEFAFLAPGRLVDNLTPQQVESGGVPPGSTRMLILGAEQQAAVERLQELYPGAAVETHAGSTPHEIAFYVVHLP